MQDFGFKLQNIKERYWFKRAVKIVLAVLALLILFLLISKTIKIFSGDSVSSDNVPLVKSTVKEVKVLPSKESGLVVDNLDVSVYDVIDNKDKKGDNPVVKKTQQNVKVDNSTNDNILTEQELLTAKINALSDDGGFDFNDDEKVEPKEVKTSANITVNGNEKKPTTNVNDLKKLGNNSLIDNIKANKDEKPGVKVQLLALKSRESLVDSWDNLKGKYPALFGDKTYYIEKADLDRIGTIYRLQVGMFDNNESANKFCQEYIKLTNKNKVDCIVVK